MPYGVPHLLAVLQSSASLQAADLRDIVYGVLAMTDTLACASDELHSISDKKIALVIDYIKELHELWKDTATYLVRREQHISRST